jgi:YD repeat-containing protein
LWTKSATSYEHNADGQVIHKEFNSATRLVWHMDLEYDNAGCLASQTDGLGNVTTFLCDGDGRTVQQETSNGSTLAAETDYGAVAGQADVVLQPFLAGQALLQVVARQHIFQPIVDHDPASRAAGVAAAGADVRDVMFERDLQKGQAEVRFLDRDLVLVHDLCHGCRVAPPELRVSANIVSAPAATVNLVPFTGHAFHRTPFRERETAGSPQRKQGGAA